MILNVQGDDRRFVSTTGANAEFRLTDVPDEWLAPGTIMYIGGFLMMPKLESPETLEVMKRARDRGCRIILDVVLYGDRPYWDAIKPLLPLTDVFLPNDHEAESISRLSQTRSTRRSFFSTPEQGRPSLPAARKEHSIIPRKKNSALKPFRRNSSAEPVPAMHSAAVSLPRCIGGCHPLNV